MTNFTHETGFEKSVGNGNFGPNTHKGTVDQEKANQMMNHLKGHNFILGKDNSTFDYKSSIKVGQNVTTSRQECQPNWATLKTNYKLGINQENKFSDYSHRFQKLEGENPNSTNFQIGHVNKTKMESDSTVLGVPGAKI